MFEKIPKELKERVQWVCWRMAVKNGRQTKIPVSPWGGSAKTNDSSTWSTFDHAKGSADMCGLDGIGFVFTADDPYVGIDIDHCRGAGGDLTSIAEEIMERYDSYTEISPSGNGLHIICEMKVPFTGKRMTWMEVYAERRFFCSTGDVFRGKDEIKEMEWKE